MIDSSEKAQAATGKHRVTRIQSNNDRCPRSENITAVIIDIGPEQQQGGQEYSTSYVGEERLSYLPSNDELAE